jgi:antirestriction protein ArdC
MSDSPHRDPVQHFANRTPAELENSVTPWVRPWDREEAGGAQAPFNSFTRSQRE